MVATPSHDALENLNEAYHVTPHTAIPSNEPYSIMGVPGAGAEREVAKVSFLNGEGDWPQVAYPNLDSPSLDSSEKAYWNILDGVIRHDDQNSESPQSMLLYEQAARKLAEVYRHMETRRLGGSVLGAIELSRERAGEMSAELFGRPNIDAFRSLLAMDVRVALAGLKTEDSARSTISGEYLDFLGMTPESAHNFVEAYGTVQPAELADETVQTIRQDLGALHPELPGMIAAFQRSEDTAAADAAPAFEAALRAFGLDAKGWRVRLTDGNRAADTHGATKEIIFGRGRKPFTSTSIVGVPVHEAIHALRKQNASEQPYSYRRTALPESLDFDEGLCVALEQVVTGEKRVGGKAYYTQLGLQLGMENNQAAPRDFRQTYELMWRQRALGQKGELTDDVLVRHKELAYRSVMRTTRGNSSDFRDSSYFEGSRKAVDYLNALSQLPTIERRNTLKWVFSGVFDPTNPTQVDVFGGVPEGGKPVN